MIRSISIEIVGGRTLELINTWYKLYGKSQGSLCAFLANRNKYTILKTRLEWLKSKIEYRVSKLTEIVFNNKRVYTCVIDPKFFRFNQDGDIVRFSATFIKPSEIQDYV